MDKSGILESMAFKTEANAPMKLRTSASISKEHGLEQDYLGKPGPRQITILSKEAWEEACREINAELPWTTRRANLLISGINLLDTVGKKLVIGIVEMEITGETEPCERMEAAFAGLQQALRKNYRGGVSSKVIIGGTITEGDRVILV